MTITARSAAAVLALVVVPLLAACAPRRAAAPDADRPQQAPPALGGATVMVLPAQVRAADDSFDALDGEIAYWLAERGPRVRWVLPAVIDRALQRNPTLDIRPRALAVHMFGVAEVQNIGDPLFGDLRRLGALVDARIALVPTAAAYITPADGGAGRVEIAAAIIDTMGGRVLWYGVAAGARGAPDDPQVFATAAEALARAVLR